MRRVPRRTGFRGFGGAPPSEVQYVGIELTSTAMYIAGGASQFNSAIKHMRAWLSLDAKRASATVNICGTNNFGAVGIGLIGETQGGVTSPDRCRVIGYHDSKYTSTSTLHYHVPSDEEFGWLQVHDVWLDTSTGRIYHAINGGVMGPGFATTSTTCATTNQLAINGRPSAPSTLGYGAMTIVGVQFSTTEPSASTIANAWSASPEDALSGCVRHFCASDLGSAGDSAGSSWVDRIGGSVTLTITGSPVLVSRSATKRPVGVIIPFGDSIAAGRRNASAPYDSDGGWRQSALAACNSAGRFATFIGQNVSSDMLDVSTASPKTFDRHHQAVAGQGLGVIVGATAAALTGMASNLSTYSHATNGVVVAYGINDLSQRIVTDGETATDAVTHLQADVDTACSTIRGAGWTGPIWIQNILKAGTGGSGITATVQTAIDSYNSGFAAMVATLNGTYGSVYSIDAMTAVTPTQTEADDAAVLYDKIHETDAAKATHGAATGAALLAV